MEIKEKVIPFPNYMKDKLDSFVKTPNLDIKYEDGKIVILTKSNWIVNTKLYKLNENTIDF